jgi:hypothetical protein
VKFPIRIYRILKKLAKCSQILGILNNTFKPTLVQKFSRIKVRAKCTGSPHYLNGSEIWTRRKKKDKKRLASIEITFLRKTEPDRPFSPEKE